MKILISLTILLFSCNQKTPKQIVEQQCDCVKQILKKESFTQKQIQNQIDSCQAVINMEYSDKINDKDLSKEFENNKSKLNDVYQKIQKEYTDRPLKISVYDLLWEYSKTNTYDVEELTNRVVELEGWLDEYKEHYDHSIDLDIIPFKLINNKYSVMGSWMLFPPAISNTLNGNISLTLANAQDNFNGINLKGFNVFDNKKYKYKITVRAILKTIESGLDGFDDEVFQINLVEGKIIKVELIDKNDKSKTLLKSNKKVSKENLETETEDEGMPKAYSSYTPIVKRAYFHTEPNDESKMKTFIVMGQSVTDSEEQIDENGKFIFVNFEYKGKVTSGWLKLTDLEEK